MEKPREWLREKSIAKKVLKESNVVLEVVDARIPLITRNSVVESLAKERNKNLIIVLNKSDLVPKDFLEQAKSLIEKDFPVIVFSAHKNIGVNQLLEKIKEYAKEKQIVKVGVLGYPNVGKSSVINALKKKKVATTSPKPGMTVGEKLIKLDENIYLIDTPGIITLEYQEDLALKGSYIPDKLPYPADVAVKLIEKILQNKKEALEEAYKVKVSNDPLQTLEIIGKKLNYKVSGGEVDYDRTAKKILWDWIKGHIKAYWL
ncbi:GTPase [Sulfurihydrogenibium subterraneum]|uniref:GTPase n=1 Tax=Sulfurihydrogenibium subterraneum TaxID=171121 RepID=UPI00048FA857|nr:GTPase [Sulfurihydrogenibium subterraneum]